ncbi:MAG: hypothetical protein HUU21_24275 [Polyangiaceae bacterium]|nr:hypothetical protein [Polyangiaceae bacterium]NUQ76668.1 hypothetical protein [Polyangiaceae bacterium]
MHVGKASAAALIKSAQNLEKWFAMTDKVVEYVRDTQRNAESYRLTLGGHVRILLENADPSRQSMHRSNVKTKR